MLIPDTKRVFRITKNAHLRQPGISGRGDRIIAVQIDGQFSRLVSVDPGWRRKPFKTHVISQRGKTTFR